MTENFIEHTDLIKISPCDNDIKFNFGDHVIANWSLNKIPKAL